MDSRYVQQRRLRHSVDGCRQRTSLPEKQILGTDAVSASIFFAATNSYLWKRVTCLPCKGVSRGGSRRHPASENVFSEMVFASVGQGTTPPLQIVFQGIRP
jgi:hypothetical protein